MLPDRSFPFTSPEYEEAVAQALATADLSIHMVGNRYGMIPEGQETGGKSIVVLQYELARQRAHQSSGFHYLVWTPNRMETKQMKPEQKLFIDELQRDPQLLQITLEEFKTILAKELAKQPADFPSVPPMAASQRPLIYVIGTPEDFKTASDLAAILRHLEQHGCEEITPQFDAQAVQNRLQNEECLRSCDAVMIYYGSGSLVWLLAKLAELRKAPGYGRQEAFLCTAVCVGPPLTAEKQSWHNGDTLLLHCGEGVDRAVLQPFLDRLAVEPAEENPLP